MRREPCGVNLREGGRLGLIPRRKFKRRDIVDGLLLRFEAAFCARHGTQLPVIARGIADGDFGRPRFSALIHRAGAVTAALRRVAGGLLASATDSAWLRYLLDGDYDEIGYITTSQRDGSGHVYNYIQDGEWYYIIDLTHYRNDWIATIEENGDIDAYSRSDRVLGNIHRTKDLSSFVNYVQDAFNDPPGLMFRLTCEDVTPLDGVRSPDGVTIFHPESYEPYVACIFDDDTDDLTYAYAPDPTEAPEY